MTNTTYKTREEWLHAFTDAARPMFKELGYELPKTLRLSVGFTSKGARSKRIGECWSNESSEDGVCEIFITPLLGDAARIADILTHELIHATVGVAAGHKKPFVDCMKAVGLAGKPTATVAGDGWWKWAQPILDDLGDLPHAKLAQPGGGASKQTTRMLKCECGSCGFTFRTTAKWLEAADGMVRCPDPFCEGDVGIG
jgi:hypothetical protein